MITRAELAGDTLAVVFAGAAITTPGRQASAANRDKAPLQADRRAIDFTLSNCLASDIGHIAIAIPADADGLVRQLRESWGEVASSAGSSIETWLAGAYSPEGDCPGSADALYRNLQSPGVPEASLVLVLPGDRVRRMDYRPLLERHCRWRADVTIACVALDRTATASHGLVGVGRHFRVQYLATEPSECPSGPGADRVLVSTGIVLFEAPFLEHLLLRDARSNRSRHDLETDILPRAVRDGRVFAYALDDSGMH